MKNPWTRKNPLMSLWLSGANKVANTARGHATAAVRRQAATSASQGAKQVTDFWTAALSPKAAPKKRSKKR